MKIPGALLRRELPGHEPRSVRLTPPPGVVDRVAEPLLRFEQRRGRYWVPDRIGHAKVGGASQRDWSTSRHKVSCFSPEASCRATTFRRHQHCREYSEAGDGLCRCRKRIVAMSAKPFLWLACGARPSRLRRRAIHPITAGPDPAGAGGDPPSRAGPAEPAAAAEPDQRGPGCQRSISLNIIWPEASSGQKSMAAVSADGRSLKRPPPEERPPR